MGTRQRVRSALADRMGFAWERDELPDMTVAEARAVLQELQHSRDGGGIGNEDTATYEHARRLVADAEAS
ncbi:MAG: hypothetical protein K2X46_11115 [Roseomonas sp.]|nr:hypothetical protein [Roseomonas sp.]